MRNLILVFVLCIPSLVQGQCPSGSVYLNSQQDILDFVTGYPNCENLPGSLLLTSDVSDVSMLSQLKTIGVNLVFASTDLINVDGLLNLTAVNGIMEIQLNENLEDLSGLANLTDQIWAVRIMFNNSLSTLNGLEGLIDLEDELFIYGNPVLENLNGLDNLSSIEGNCEIYNNNLLNDISALGNLTSISGVLKIHSNPNLNSIQALDNVDNFVSGLEIYDCPLLSICDIQPVCNYLQDGGMPTINNNASGCNSIVEIESVCALVSNCAVNPSDPLGVWPSFIGTLEQTFSVSTSGFTSPNGFEWDFGDGTIINGGSNITHIYSNPGTYEVCVAAFNMNCTASYCQNITVFGPANPCIVQEINISTGYDPVNTQYLSPIANDPIWELIQVPPSAANWTVPRPAFVIDKFSAWIDADNSQWISSNQVANYSPNNCNLGNCACPPYKFQRSFCMPSRDSVTFDFDVLHDDLLSIDLVDISGISTNIYDGCTPQPAGNYYFQVARSVNTTLLLEPGSYSIQVNLFNTGGSAMGFNIEGVLSGVAIESDICCSNLGSIVGTVYNDLDCDGEFDIIGNTFIDPSLAGWEITLCKLDGTFVATSISDQNGIYSFSDLPTGEYILKETIQGGWTSSEPSGGQTTVTVSPLGVIEVNFGNCRGDCNLFSGIIVDAAECTGAATGMISVQTGGGTPPYDYDWSNGLQSSTISNLAPGTYTVTITDVVACTLVESVVVEQDLDETPPTITGCPIDIVLPCDLSSNGASYIFAINGVEDDCSSTYTEICSHPSGTIFPQGTTTVTCTVVDASGNESTPCEFDVTVRECLNACCLDTLGFESRRNGGFSSYVDGCEINLSPKSLDTCDFLVVEWGDGASTNSLSGFDMNYTYAQSGEYEICAIFSVISGSDICLQKDSCWTICVECEDCANPMFTKEWTKTIADFGFGSGEEREMGLAIKEDTIYVSGGYTGPTNFGDGLLPYNSNSDMFWAKYDSGGNIINSLGAGGQLDDYATAIEPDVISDAYYVGGYFTSEEVLMPSTLPFPLSDSKGLFIAKYTANDELLWAKNFGTTTISNFAFETLRDITIDPEGNIYIVGRYHNAFPINFGNNTLPGTSLLGGFVAKFDSSGSLLWELPIVGDGYFANVVTGADTDSDGNLYITGGFGGEVDFNPNGIPTIEVGSCPLCTDNTPNMFLAKYSPAGILDWVVNASGPTSNTNITNSSLLGWDVKVDDNGVYVTGQMNGQGTEFNPNAASLNSIILSNAPGNSNLYGFLGRYNKDNGEADWAFNLPLNGKLLGMGIDPLGNIGIAGFFFKGENTALDLDPDPENELLISSHAKDGFFAKYNPNGELITGMNLSGNGNEELHDVAFDNDGNLYTIGYNDSSNLDDDPVSQTNSLLNSGVLADIFIGKYDCNCSSTDSECCNDLDATLDSLGNCCYEMNLTNNYGFTISEVEISMDTEDVIFNNNTLAFGYTFNYVSDDLLIISHISGSIPTGSSSEVLTFCLANISGSSPPSTQDITIRWKGLNEIDGTFTVLCEEEEITNCSFISFADCVNFSPTTTMCSSESDQIYTLDFTVTNQSLVAADALIINSQTTGFTLTECSVPSMFSETNIVYTFPNPLAGGDTSDNICLNIVSPELLQESTEICFTFSLESSNANESCCTEAVEYCITLEPCCLACEEVGIISESWEDGNGDCCYEIGIENNCANNFYSGIEISIETPDVIFGAIQNGSSNTGTFSTNGTQSMTWLPNDEYISTGISENIVNFCLDRSNGASTVNFDWLVSNDTINKDSVYCSEKLNFECNSNSNCVNFGWESICANDSMPWYEMVLIVENVSNPAFNAQQVIITGTPGVHVFGGVTTLNPNLANGSSQQIQVIIVPNTFPFSEENFEFCISIKDAIGEICCQEFEKLIIPVPSVNTNDPCLTPVSTIDLSSEIKATIFPNPFTEGFIVNFSDPINEYLNLSLWDISGRKILSAQIGKEETQFEISSDLIPIGFYLLQLQNADGKSFSRKIIKN